jgi:DNA repair protein RAD5
MDDADDFLSSLDRDFSTPSLTETMTQFAGGGRDRFREERRRRREQRNGENGNGAPPVALPPQATAAPENGADPILEEDEDQGHVVEGDDELPSNDEGDSVSSEDGYESSSESGSESSSSSHDERRQEAEEEEDVASARHLRAKEVIDFLQALPSVDPERLPTATLPSVLQQHAALKPFQLQAVSWLAAVESRLGTTADLTAPLSFPVRDTVTRAIPLPVVPTTQRLGSGAFNFGMPMLPGMTAFPTMSIVRPATAVAPSATVPAAAPGPTPPTAPPMGAGPTNAGSAPPVQVAGGILADYMGLGKTRTLICHCESTRPPRSRIDRLSGSRVSSQGTLIVCPVSLMRQWAAEVRQCTQGYPSSVRPSILFYYGTTKKRKSIFDIASFHYVITSYATLAAEFTEGDAPGRKVANIKWHRIILDEAHTIRNPHTKMSRACFGLLSDRRWAVTATPIQNRLGDIQALLRFLKVPVFSEMAWFDRHIARPLLEQAEEQNQEVGDGEEDRRRGPSQADRAMQQLKALLSVILLRRKPSTLIGGQPIITLTPKVIEVRPVELSAEERDFYDAVHQSATVKLDSIVRSTTQLTKFATAFEMLMRCRQALLHPYLVVNATFKRQMATGTIPNSWDAENDGDPNASAAIQDPNLKRFVDQLKRKMRHVQGEFAEQVLSEVQSATITQQECTICLDAMSRPGILPCGHSFCMPCITMALEARPLCPLCKRRTRLAEVSEMPEVAPTPTPGVGPTVLEIVSLPPEEWKVSAKFTELLKIIAEVPDDERIVVFSVFLTFLRYVEVQLKLRGITTQLYHGGLSVKQRDDAVTKFSRRHGPKVLLASTTSTSVGLNLVRANHAVLMEPTWNPGVEEQAMNRIHRIGQERPVRIIRLIVPNSIDEQIYKLSEAKAQLGEACIEHRTASRLTQDHIRSLFTGGDTPARHRQNPRRQEEED